MTLKDGVRGDAVVVLDRLDRHIVVLGDPKQTIPAGHGVADFGACGFGRLGRRQRLGRRGRSGGGWLRDQQRLPDGEQALCAQVIQLDHRSNRDIEKEGDAATGVPRRNRVFDGWERGMSGLGGIGGRDSGDR